MYNFVDCVHECMHCVQRVPASLLSCYRPVGMVCMIGLVHDQGSLGGKGHRSGPALLLHSHLSLSLQATAELFLLALAFT